MSGYNGAFAWKFDNDFCRDKDRAYLIGQGHKPEDVDAWQKQEEAFPDFGGWGYTERQLDHYFAQYLRTK